MLGPWASTVSRVQIIREVDTEHIRGLLDRQELFWLDLVDPTDTDLNDLGDLIDIHPLALEDTREFNQRVKLDDYEHGALLVFYGAERSTREDRPQMVEVHLHICKSALVTVRRQPLAALSDVSRRVDASPPEDHDHPVYEVLDALADSVLESLDGFDDAIDELQDAVVEHATPAHRRRIFELRRHIAELRHVVVPERDVLTPADALIDALPASGRLGERDRVRDISDHLEHAAGLITSYREQLAGLLDLYLTEVSNGMNEVMKRLTFIATVFLPLTFISGFFGMNFGWLVKETDPAWTFPVFGVGLLVVSTLAVIVYLKRTDRL